MDAPAAQSIRSPERGLLEIVFFYAVDRLARERVSFWNAEKRLQRLEIPYRFLDVDVDPTTDEGCVTIGIMQLSADLWLRRHKRRIKDAWAKRREEGYPPGGLPPHGVKWQAPETVKKGERRGWVVDSIRWEAIRDGAEDYEYLWLLGECARLAEQRGVARDLLPHARRLLAIDDNVVRSFKDHNPDPAQLVAARADMGTTIEALCRALGSQPPDVPLRTRRALPAAAPPPVAEPPQTVQMPASPAAVALSEASGAAGGFYRFEGTQGYVVDDSRAGNHGIVQGGEREARRFGQGLKLSGDRSAVTLPAAATLLGGSSAQGTLALWVKPYYDPLKQPGDTWSGWTIFLYAQRTSGNRLPDGYNEIGLSAHGQTLIGKVNTTGDYESYPTTPMQLRQGLWTHLALTWTPNQRVLYVDGKAVVRTAGNFAPTLLDGCPVLVGMHPPTGRWNFKGSVDDVLVTPRALTAEQIAALAQGDVAGLQR